MKAKTIKTVLRKKIDEWLDSIEDETVRDLARQNTIVTGGSIASMLLKESVNDYDIYFMDKETVKTVAEYYVKKFKENPPPRFKEGIDIPIYVEEKDDRIKIVVKSAGIAGENKNDDYQYFEQLDDIQNYQVDEYIEQVIDTPISDEKPKYRPVFLSSNAITLSNGIQIVIRFYGDADKIHENYDFTHCTNYWIASENRLELRKEALEALLTRELVYQGSKYPLCSIIRTRKFIKRGWSINAGQYLKMVMQLNQLDLSDLEVLEEQLIGVDVAYFQEVIDKLKEKDDKKVDHTYLMTIIDRMF